MIPPKFFLVRIVHMLFDLNFCITYMYIHNCVPIIFKIWYMTIILSYFLLCALHLMQGFVYEKMLQGNLNYSQDRSFLTENEENPALVLSNVHNRTGFRIRILIRIRIRMDPH